MTSASYCTTVIGLSDLEAISVPDVIFPGKACQADIDMGKLDNSHAYLVKPDASELIHTIQRLLDDTRSAPP